MSEFVVFDNPEFGEIRTIELNGEPWFVGKDVAVALGYENHRKALIDHVAEEDKLQGGGVTIRDPMGREQHPTVINESGLYSLIIRSQLKNAKRFKHWVTHEILPILRKTGTYSVVSALAPATRSITTDDYLRAASIVANCRNERLPYVLDFLEQGGFSTLKIEEQCAAYPAQAVAKVLNEALSTHGFTQTQICNLTGTDKVQISRYRKGLCAPGQIGQS